MTKSGASSTGKKRPRQTPGPACTLDVTMINKQERLLKRQEKAHGNLGHLETDLANMRKELQQQTKELRASVVGEKLYVTGGLENILKMALSDISMIAEAQREIDKKNVEKRCAAAR